jgi:hypothetical protein
MGRHHDVTVPVNLGNPGEFTIRELAQTIFALLGSSRIIHMPLPAVDISSVSWGPTRKHMSSTAATAQDGRYGPKIPRPRSAGLLPGHHPVCSSMVMLVNGWHVLWVKQQVALSWPLRQPAPTISCTQRTTLASAETLREISRSANYACPLPASTGERSCIVIACIFFRHRPCVALRLRLGGPSRDN